MDYLFLILSVCLGTATSLISRVVKKGVFRLSTTSLVNTATFFSALITLFIVGVVGLQSEFFTAFQSVNLLLAFLYGACLLLAQFCFLLAVGRGPVSISTLFYACGFILPTLYGMLRFHESVRPLQIVGVALIVCAFILSTDLKGEKKKADFLWLIFALGGLVFSGGIGIVQKEYAVVANCPIDTYLFCAFAFTTLFSALLTAILFRREKKTVGQETERKALPRALYGSLLLGGIMGGANKLNTYLAGVFASVITFPVVNGGRILLTTLLGALCFREKINLRQTVGVLCGFIAIVLLAI